MMLTSGALAGHPTCGPTATYTSIIIRNTAQQVLSCKPWFLATTFSEKQNEEKVKQIFKQGAMLREQQLNPS